MAKVVICEDCGADTHPEWERVCGNCGWPIPEANVPWGTTLPPRASVEHGSEARSGPARQRSRYAGGTRAAILISIVVGIWLGGSVAISILFGPAVVVSTGSGRINLSGAIAFGIGIALAVWFDRSQRNVHAPQAPVAQPPRPAVHAELPRSDGAEPTPERAEVATKVCPDCAETVLAGARICRFCRYEFWPSSAATRPTPEQ